MLPSVARSLKSYQFQSNVPAMETTANGDSEHVGHEDVFATIVANQQKILANQKTITSNQKKLEQILANQKTIAGNQKKLEQILANQRTIVGNQKKILAKK